MSPRSLSLRAPLGASALVVTLLVGCAERGGAGGGAEYVAIERDFEGFEGWTAFDRGSQPVGPTHPDGSSFVYVNRMPPPGARSFATGTIIVRRTTHDDGVIEVHAMAKRGGNYNASGAAGWEFFDLDLAVRPDGTTEPRIVWRGEGPQMGDGYVVPDGGVILSCNHCHASFPENDSVIGPELELRSL
jgi:hypothetical protein